MPGMLLGSRMSIRAVRTSGRPLSIILALCLFLAWPAWAQGSRFVQEAEAGQFLRVLYINSYHPGYPWSDGIQNGLRQGLESASGLPIDLRVEYLDSKRHTPGRLRGSILALWEAKYRDVPLDLLVASDQDAYDLLGLARDRLFPGVPLLHASVEDPGRPAGNSVGIQAGLDLQANLSLAMRLRPGLRHLWLLTDPSTTGRINRAKAVRIADSLGLRDRLAFFDDGRGIEPDSLLRKVRQVDPDDVVLLLDYATSPAGAVELSSFLPRLAGALPAPLLSHREQHLEWGACGGVMSSGEFLGRQLAELAVQVLRGADVGTLHALPETSRPLFRHDQLSRFGISEDRLPLGSEVRHRPESFWAANGRAILAGLAVVLLEGLLIVWLAVLLRRQRALRREADRATGRFRRLFELAPVPMAAMDPDGRLLGLNRQFTTVTGYTLDDIPTEDDWFRRAFPSESEARLVRDRWHQLLDLGDILVPVAHRITCRDGSPKSLEIVATREGGDLLACLIDVTERMAQQAELAERGQRAVLQRGAITRLAVEAGLERLETAEALDEICAVLRSTLEVSQASLWRLELGPERLVCVARHRASGGPGQTGDRLDPADSPDYFAVMRREGRYVARDTLADPRIHGLDEYFRAQQVRALLDVAILTEGELVGVVCCEMAEAREWHADEEAFAASVAALTAQLLAVQRRRQAEEEREKLRSQLLQSQKLESVGRLAGGVAHDFNNMLGVILGHAELALSSTRLPEELVVHLDEIRGAATRSANLTRQLLAFARKETVAPRVLDLNETVEGMLKMLRRLIGEDIRLAWKPGLELWPVKMDPSQVDQILANLCVNARDAITNGGHLTIETRNCVFDLEDCTDHTGFLPGSYVRLSVSDTGCGMSAETLAHIFEPFYTTKPTGQGTGLGLATVYGAVRQNNGFINVYSEPGHGTTFSLYFPREQEGATSPEPAKEAAADPPQEPGKHILLVEDEPAILDITRTMLTRLGYEVMVASSPAEALRRMESLEGPLDLVMTDVVMPEMNGRELVGRLQGLRPGLHYLYMSGYTADVIANHGVLEDGVPFIQKPFTLKELAQKLHDTLRMRPPAPERSMAT